VVHGLRRKLKLGDGLTFSGRAVSSLGSRHAVEFPSEIAPGTEIGGKVLFRAHAADGQMVTILVRGREGEFLDVGGHVESVLESAVIVR
jgi:hypothetical protein